MPSMTQLTCMSIPERPDRVLVLARSILNGRVNVMELPISFDEYHDGMAAWRSGTLIQFAFPTLSADEREFLMTGVRILEWDTEEDS
jgi:hypothetical protein